MQSKYLMGSQDARDLYEIWGDVSSQVNTTQLRAFFNSPYYLSSGVALLILSEQRKSLLQTENAVIILLPTIHPSTDFFLPLFYYVTGISFVDHITCLTVSLLFLVSFGTNLFVSWALRCVISLNACCKQIFKSRLFQPYHATFKWNSEI